MSFFIVLKGSGSSAREVRRATLSHSRNSFHRRELYWGMLLLEIRRRFSETGKGHVRFSVSLPVSFHYRQRRFGRQYFGRAFIERIRKNYRISVRIELA